MRTYAAALALLLTLTACGPSASPTEQAEPPAASGQWTRLPDMPLSPRTAPVLAWTGSEVLVVGGNTGWVCPPNADCTTPEALAADGAAFDPAAGTWRAIAPAPVGLWDSWGSGWDSVLAGGTLVVRGTKDGTWQGYDVADDSWSVLTPPKGFGGQLSASGARLWSLSGKRILSWDPTTDDVRVEASYATPRPLEDAQLFVTPEGPVLTGVRYDEAAPDEPTLTQVDVPDGSGGWRRIVSGQIGWLSHWDGEHLFGVEPGEADGGGVDGWGRAYPYAGRLDPVSGEWSPLDVPRPDRTASSDWWDVSAVDGSRVVSYGRFADVSSGARTWTDLGRPDTVLDQALSATWAGDRLLVIGGVDEARGYESPSPPEAWAWVPPTG